MIVSYRDAYNEDQWILVSFWFDSISGLYHLFVQPPKKKNETNTLFLYQTSPVPKGHRKRSWIPGMQLTWRQGRVRSWMVRLWTSTRAVFRVNYIKTRLENDFTLNLSQNWIDPICHRPMKCMILMSKYVN